jgi:hypothetical protein
MTAPNFCCSECSGRVSVTTRGPRRRIVERSRSMKARTISSLLLLLVLVGGCTAPAQHDAAHRDYATDLDFTTATDFDAAGLGGSQELRAFGTDNIKGFSDDYIFGEYRSPMDLTGGHNFHAFPDGCFVIEEFCDVGEPITIASGQWKLDGNSLLVVDLVERKKSSAPLGMKWIRQHFGGVERLRVFVTANGESIGDTILISEDTAALGRHVEWKYVRRAVYYRDWPKRQRDLLKQ